MHSPTLTRRAALLGAFASSAALAVPAVAALKPAMTAQERRDFHLAEFKRACEEIDPMIGSWSDWLDEDDQRHHLVAHRISGRYEGDGLYESSRVDALGNRRTMSVKLTPARIDGFRTFSVTCPGERLLLTEPCLETYIRRKLAA